MRGRAGGGGDTVQLQARVRGLLNRLAESNLPGIAGEVADLMTEEGRLAVTQAISDELLSVSGYNLISEHILDLHTKSRICQAIAAEMADLMTPEGRLAVTQAVSDQAAEREYEFASLTFSSER